MKRGVICFIVFSLNASSILIAQEGFKLGFDGPILSSYRNNSDAKNGLGAGIRIEYGVTNNFTAGINASRVSYSNNTIYNIGEFTSSLGEFVLYNLYIEGKYFFANGSKIRPFTKFGFGEIHSNSVGWGTVSTGIIVGGGLENRIGQHSTMNVAVTYHGGDLHKDNRFERSFIAFNFGLTFDFNRGCGW